MLLKSSVYVVGPSSTGKTTLCLALARRLGIERDQLVSEIARTVMKTHGFNRMDVGRLEMQEAILNAILDEHDSQNPVKPHFRIHDRSAIDPVVYAVLTAKDEPEARSRKDYLISSSKFQSALGSYRRSIFILLKPVREWMVDDGVRSLEDMDRCYEVFQSVLKECEIPFREIGVDVGFLEERVGWLMGLCV